MREFYLGKRGKRFVKGEFCEFNLDIVREVCYCSSGGGKIVF